MVIEAFYQSDEETWLYDFEHFLHFDYIEANFDYWKDSLGDLTFETLITILTIENLNSVNHCYLTINCDTGQHSQFLWCFKGGNVKTEGGFIGCLNIVQRNYKFSDEYFRKNWKSFQNCDWELRLNIIKRLWLNCDEYLDQKSS